MKSFRSEIFNLCNTLSAMDQFSDLRNTMASLRISSSETNYDPKTDVCINGIHLLSEFYGILLAFQYKLCSFPSVETSRIALSDNEYRNITFGHYYISHFIEMCLADIKHQNSIIGKMMSPYSFFKPIEDIPTFSIDSSIFENAVKAYKNSTVYRSLIDSQALVAFNGVPEDTIRMLFNTLYREIIRVPTDKVPKEILSLKLREQSFLPNQRINPIDALQLTSYKLLALREMLSIAASIIYDAILGRDLIVIDENCLITVENNSSNAIYSYKTILIQGGLTCPFNDILNTVFLLNINNNRAKIHDFGRAYSSTFSFANENGDTTKLSYFVLDEELNPISNLTNK